MKKAYLIILILSIGILPFFQNCGMSAATGQTGALVVGEKLPDCLATVVDCGPKPEYLEITIDLSNPSEFNLADGSLTLYGRCNSGNYPYHGIHFQVFLTSDPSAPLDEYTARSDEYIPGGSYYGHCVDGRYARNINLSGYLANTAYYVKVQMYGYENKHDTRSISNVQSTGSAVIDFTVK